VSRSTGIRCSSSLQALGQWRRSKKRARDERDLVVCALLRNKDCDIIESE